MGLLKMSGQNDFYMEATPRISVFVAENGNLQINVTQMDDQGEKVEFNSVELPRNCVQPVAEAMLRLAQE